MKGNPIAIYLTVGAIGIGVGLVVSGLLIKPPKYEIFTTTAVNNGITTTEIIRKPMPIYSTTIVVNGDTTTTEIIEK